MMHNMMMMIDIRPTFACSDGHGRSGRKASIRGGTGSDRTALYRTEYGLVGRANT